MRGLILMILGVMLIFVSGIAYPDTKFSMSQWMQLDQAKKLAVIELVIKKNADAADKVIIRLPASHYVEALDDLATNTIANGNGAELDTQSVGVSFKTIAVMDCDWDNGQNPLEFAKQLMGPKIFARYQADYPDKYLLLSKGCR